MIPTLHCPKQKTWRFLVSSSTRCAEFTADFAELLLGGAAFHPWLEVRDAASHSWVLFRFFVIRQ